MKFCKSCKHIGWRHADRGARLEARCMRPITGAMDLVTGERITSAGDALCKVERSGGGTVFEPMCGPDGRFFEPAWKP